MKQEKMAEKQVYTNRELVDMLDFLNAQLGLERCMDDEEFYLDILDAFVEENLLDELKGFYLENNWNKYRIKSHTLKSSSAYIGAEELSAFAKRMEQAAKEMDDEYINRNHYRFMGYYEELLRAIDKVLAFREKGGERTAQMALFKALVVDDSKLDRMAVRDAISSQFQVECVSSGAQMFGLLERGFVPDIILLDLNMPEMDGHEALQKLKKDERFMDIPVAVMTSDSRKDSELQAFREGAVEYLLKPLQPEIAMARVNRLVQLSHLQKNLQHEVRLRTKADKEKSKRMSMVFDQIVEALVNTIDAKDKYTKGHSERVAKYSVMIAKHMEFEEEQISYIRYAAMLHDIGKIGVPDEIINKPSRLTDEEYAVIKKHPAIGEEILKSITAVPDIASGARWHHERYDGRGYPDGIADIDIPEIARIISVADAYDAMTSGRAYRKRMTQAEVREQIVNGIGTQFDPVFGNIMLDIIDEDSEFELQE